MAENKMDEVAKLLGVEMGVPFNVKGSNYNPYRIEENGLYNSHNCCDSILLKNLLTGIEKIEQPILDDIEKRYLEGVLRPFKDRVNYIYKEDSIYSGYNDAFINVSLNRYDNVEKDDNISLPYFHKDKMYKGMELNKEYTLEELGLFENE